MPDSASARPRVPGEERVFSLVLALVASPQGLSRDDLLSSVYGYADRYSKGEPDAAVERRFERDKEQVRGLGIPIETIDAPGEPGNNRLTRYRIAKDRLQLPSDVRFNAAELTLLRMASLAWSDGSLGSESRWAGMKLASLGANLDTRHLGIAPRLGIPEPAAPALQSAIDEGRVVRFDYQLPERDEPLTRRVAPLRLHRAEGRWHLIAHDLERGAERVFLLSRIASAVSLEAESFDPELMQRIDPALAELLALAETQRAVVEVRAGSAAEARLAPRAETILDAHEHRIELGTLDMHALASELAGFGDEVVVHAPPQLRDETVELLGRIRDQHTEEAAHA